MNKLQDNKLLKQLPNIVSAILVVLLGVLLAKIVWMFMAPPSETVALVDSGVSDSQPDNVEVATNYGEEIAKYHLFGKADAPKVLKADPAKAKKTRLNLKLHGVFFKNQNEGYALISEAGKAQEVKQKGDKVSGVTVHSILEDRVMLERNGQLEVLELEKVSESSGSGINNIVRQPSPTSPPLVEDPDPPMDTPPKFSVDNLDDFRNEVVADPNKLNDLASAEAVVEEGKFKGFRVNPGNNPDLFASVGFVEGDIVIAVNGVVLDSQEKGLEVLNELVESSSIAVTVLREGVEVNLNASF